jgi:hypothetical protein
MTTINPSLIPTKSPGTIFNNLTGLDSTLNLRWLTPTDPVFYAALNRPLADITVRQLVIAKAVDNLQLRLGNQNLYPFLVQPKVVSGTNVVDVPLQWIWDFHASLPKKWERLRLAKIKRISGTNDVTSGATGFVRLIFTANVQGSPTEVAIFYADYLINSNLTYQPVRLSIVDSVEESVSLAPGESETVAGFLIFRTLDLNLSTVQAFFDLVAPPLDTTDADADGFFDTPAVYELLDTIPGGIGVSDDFSSSGLSHGTGLLTDSAWNSIPELDSDIQSWVNAFNYPFDATANRLSVEGIAIPKGIFREFEICAPAGDSPTGDISGLFFPVFISRVERVDFSGTQLRFYFATFNTTTAETGGTPSPQPVEFASLDLLSNFSPGDIVEIIPIDNLKLQTGADADNWRQGFGRGHVVLSSLWDGVTNEISNFFSPSNSVATVPADISFSSTATRISSFGISRVPQYIPTIGQSQALLGSTSRLLPSIPPSVDNRYITEADQGLGRTIDLEAQPGIAANINIDRFGSTGSLAHRTVKLVVNSENLGSDPNFYNNIVLPRLRILFGRDPIFGDEWFNGTRFMKYNGDSWQG